MTITRESGVCACRKTFPAGSFVTRRGGRVIRCPACVLGLKGLGLATYVRPRADAIKHLAGLIEMAGYGTAPEHVELDRALTDAPADVRGRAVAALDKIDRKYIDTLIAWQTARDDAEYRRRVSFDWANQ